MSDDLNFIGFRWYDDRLEVNFHGRPTFTKYERPNIPGIEFDTLLHFEPSANKYEYIRGGYGQQMTEVQKEACLQFIKSMDVPGFAYDPTRFNIYMGIKTSSEAKSLGLKLTYVPVTTDTCKFNTTDNKWDEVHAIICQEGKAFLHFSNNPNVEETSNCAAEMQNAILLLTEEEWETVSASRKHETDVFNFKDYTWTDTRDIAESRTETLTSLSRMLHMWEQVYSSTHFDGLTPQQIESVLELTPSQILFVKTMDPSLENIDCGDDSIKEVCDTYSQALAEYTLQKKDLEEKIISLMILVKHVTSFEELDEINRFVTKYTEELLYTEDDSDE